MPRRTLPRCSPWITPSTMSRRTDLAVPKRRAADAKPARKRPGSEAVRNFPVAGIGASAGGLEAFVQLLKGLPTDTGMAFVLVQHLDPKHDSQLAGLLERATQMPVCEAVDGLILAAKLGSRDALKRPDDRCLWPVGPRATRECDVADRLLSTLACG